MNVLSGRGGVHVTPEVDNPQELTVGNTGRTKAGLADIPTHSWLESNTHKSLRVKRGSHWRCFGFFGGLSVTTILFHNCMGICHTEENEGFGPPQIQVVM